MRTSDDIKQILRKHGIDVFPEGEILDCAYMRYKDWYIFTAEGCFWWDGHEWKFCPQGPML